MNFNRIIIYLQKFGTWLAHFFFLYILWIVFTVMGLGLLGLFPATSAVFYVIYNWFNKHTDIKILPTFTYFFKEYFFKSNIIGFISVGIGLFLIFDLRVSLLLIQSPVLYYIILFLSIIFLVITLYIFTVFSRYELNIKDTFKQSFFIAIASPIETIAMIICLVLIILLYWIIPLLAFLFGPILPIFLFVWFAYQACIKVENKNQEIEE